MGNIREHLNDSPQVLFLVNKRKKRKIANLICYFNLKGILTDYVGSTLVDKSGEKHPTSEMTGKHVALFIAAEWDK